MNLSNSFLAADTPTISGKIQNILILMSLMMSTIAKNDSSNLFLKNFSILK